MRALLLAILLFLLPTTAFAQINIPCWMPVYAPEIKAMYFRPSSKHFRDIFASGAGRFDFDVNVQLSRCLWLWSGAGYYKRHGRSFHKQIKSRITLVPVTLGMKLHIPYCYWIDVFVGAGARLNYVHLKNHGSYPLRNFSKWRWGYALTTGFRMFLDGGVYLSPFAEASSIRGRIHKRARRSLCKINNVGGFSIGAGFGIVI